MDRENDIAGKCDECAELTFAMPAEGEGMPIPTCLVNKRRATWFVSPEECRFRRREK